jgi:hypothetical protein
MRLFVKSVLRRIFGPKGDELRGEWRKLHNKRSLMICNPREILFG